MQYQKGLMARGTSWVRAYPSRTEGARPSPTEGEGNFGMVTQPDRSMVVWQLNDGTEHRVRKIRVKRDWENGHLL